MPYSLLLPEEMACEYWENGLLSIDGVPSPIRISKMCGAVPRQLQAHFLFLLGSISLHEFRPTYIPGKPPRYPSLPSRQSTTALSHGFRGNISRNTLAHANQVRDWRDLCDFAHLLIGQAEFFTPTKILGSSLKQTVYCLRCHDRRSLSVSFSLGQVPPTKGSHQTPHPDGLRGSIPTLISSPLQSPRSQFFSTTSS